MKEKIATLIGENTVTPYRGSNLIIQTFKEFLKDVKMPEVEEDNPFVRLDEQAKVRKAFGDAIDRQLEGGDC